jgi:hypothetical protein
MTRCANCGAWVYAERTSTPEFRSILASTLDDVSKLVLLSNVFVVEAAPWTVFDTSLTQFQKMPEAELPERGPA